MRNVHLAVILLAFVAHGCDGGSRPLPSAPSVVPASPTATSREPVLSPAFQYSRQPDLGTPIALGQIVSSRVTDDDPTCGDVFPNRCQYFRLPVPQDGVLEVTIRWNATQRNSYPLDMGVIGPSGMGWVSEFANGPYRNARGRVSGGGTYVIEVWSFLMPHEPFELIASLEQR